MQPIPLSNVEQLNDPAWVQRFNEERLAARTTLPGSKVTVVTETGIMPVKHGLGRIPRNVFIVRPENQTISLRDERNTREWDETNIYVSFSVASQVVDLQIV